MYWQIIISKSILGFSNVQLSLTRESDWSWAPPAYSIIDPYATILNHARADNKPEYKAQGQIYALG